MLFNHGIHRNVPNHGALTSRRNKAKHVFHSSLFSGGCTFLPLYTLACVTFPFPSSQGWSFSKLALVQVFTSNAFFLSCQHNTKREKATRKWSECTEIESGRESHRWVRGRCTEIRFACGVYTPLLYTNRRTTKTTNGKAT